VQEWGNGIFYYAADLSSAGWSLTKYDSYWFSVASFEPGWTWALVMASQSSAGSASWLWKHLPQIHGRRSSRHRIWHLVSGRHWFQSLGRRHCW